MDFLILAGDVFDSQHTTVRARVTFMEGAQEAGKGRKLIGLTPQVLPSLVTRETNFLLLALAGSLKM